TVTSASINEQATCDPAIVKPGDGYYYMFYGGAVDGPQTVVLVARSTKIGGPYEKLRTNNTWAIDPVDPKIIVWPSNTTLRNSYPYDSSTGAGCKVPLNVNGKCPAGTGGGNYGAGIPTVVYRAGTYHMWFRDETIAATRYTT